MFYINRMRRQSEYTEARMYMVAMFDALDISVLEGFVNERNARVIKFLSSRYVPI